MQSMAVHGSPWQSMAVCQLTGFSMPRPRYHVHILSRVAAISRQALRFSLLIQALRLSPPTLPGSNTNEPVLLRQGHAVADEDPAAAQS
jgi:hypothetical protein